MPVSVSSRCVVSRVKLVRLCLGVSMQTLELRRRFGDMRKQHFESCTFNMGGQTVHGSLIMEDDFEVRHHTTRDE